MIVMKLRFSVRCERCKGLMPFGTSAVRFHGRYWHHVCVLDYKRQRHLQTQR